MCFLKRTWLQVDCDALEENYCSIRNIVNKKSKIMCVLKADAYGHGAGFVSKLYQRLGADWLAVSNIEEAIQIRKNKVVLPILILGYTHYDMVNQLSLYSITQTVISLDYAKKLSQQALKFGFSVDVHIKLDTGMNRIGLVYQDFVEDSKTIEQVQEICSLKNLNIKGIYTHFSSSDEEENCKDYTLWQFNNFKNAIKILKEKNIRFELKHCSNSGAILTRPFMNMDMVRAGIVLYGILPNSNIKTNVKLKPAMQWKTIVSQIKNVRKNSAISYNRTFYTSKNSKIAIVPTGYADGYPRIFSGKAKMIINGRKVPIIGRICMDQLVLDISEVQNVENNNIVTIFGKDGKSTITLDELASLSNTINYELLCIISKRVTRVFMKKNKILETFNYIRQF
ncbi:MAG: alanine racemase [Oscillospiraceae bacterium]|jgi:alanine racemase|nr:alanine racemase [Oscillospiraceae bacterium]